MTTYSVKIVSGLNGTERFTVEADGIIDALGKAATQIEGFSEEGENRP
jgi:hypothetical protein